MLAVATAGASAFIDMYATQPLLPELRATFGASEAAVGLNDFRADLRLRDRGAVRWFAGRSHRA